MCVSLSVHDKTNTDAVDHHAGLSILDLRLDKTTPNLSATSNPPVISVIDNDHLPTRSKRRSRAKAPADGVYRMVWTHELERVLLDVMIDFVNRGQRTPIGFKESTWAAAAAAVRAKAPEQLQPACVVAKMKGKMDTFKKDYRIWTQMMSQSGWSKDGNGCPTADSDSMELYFEAHREARKFKDRPLMHEHELAVLYTDDLATGSFVKTAQALAIDVDIAPDGEEEDEDSLESFECSTPTTMTSSPKACECGDSRGPEAYSTKDGSSAKEA